MRTLIAAVLVVAVLLAGCVSNVNSDVGPGVEDDPPAHYNIGDGEPEGAEADAEPPYQLNPLTPREFNLYDPSTWEHVVTHSIEGEDIFLYVGSARIFVLSYKGQFVDVSHWPRPTNSTTARLSMMYYDLDGDGINELVVARSVPQGHNRWDLHVLTIERDEASGEYSFTEHTLLSYDVHHLIDIPIHAALGEDGKSFRVDFMDESFTVAGDEFGHWERYMEHFVEMPLEVSVRNSASFHVGVQDEDGQRDWPIRMSFTYSVHFDFGDFTVTSLLMNVSAQVLFDGENFTLTNYHMRPHVTMSPVV